MDTNNGSTGLTNDASNLEQTNEKPVSKKLSSPLNDESIDSQDFETDEIVLLKGKLINNEEVDVKLAGL